MGQCRYQALLEICENKEHTLQAHVYEIRKIFSQGMSIIDCS